MPDATPLALAERIATATDLLRARQAERDKAWSEIYVETGRALEAAESGNVDKARAIIVQIADAEYDLLGDCDTFGPLEPEDGGPHG